MESQASGQSERQVSHGFYKKLFTLLMGDEKAKRQITHLTYGVIILKDSFNSAVGTIEKQKLIHLYPDHYRWTSKHLAGPNRHSQFL